MYIPDKLMVDPVDLRGRHTIVTASRRALVVEYNGETYFVSPRVYAKVMTGTCDTLQVIPREGSGRYEGHMYKWLAASIPVVF